MWLISVDNSREISNVSVSITFIWVKKTAKTAHNPLPPHKRINPLRMFGNHVNLFRLRHRIKHCLLFLSVTLRWSTWKNSICSIRKCCEFVVVAENGARDVALVVCKMGVNFDRWTALKLLEVVSRLIKPVNYEWRTQLRKKITSATCH